MPLIIIRVAQGEKNRYCVEQQVFWFYYCTCSYSEYVYFRKHLLSLHFRTKYYTFFSTTFHKCHRIKSYFELEKSLHSKMKYRWSKVFCFLSCIQKLIQQWNNSFIETDRIPSWIPSCGRCGNSFWSYL